MIEEIINNNQKWTFLNFKNNKINYKTDEDKLQLFLELRAIDKLSKTFRCKEIISNFNSNILKIRDEVINNESLRFKLKEYKEKEKIKKEKIERLSVRKDDSVLNIIKKQLGL